MMSKVSVPRAELAALVGLTADADDETLQKAIDEKLIETNTQRVAASAAQLEADDRRLVEAAIQQGKFGPSRREHWLHALKQDRDGAKSVIAVLAAVPQAFTGQPAFDPEIERVSAITTGRPYEPAPAPQAAVQAAAAQRAPSQRGTDPVTSMQELNAAIEADPQMHRAVWAIGGPGFGLKKPAEPMTAYPDVEEPWNPKPRLVVHDDGTGHWETPKADWELPGFGGTPPATEGN
jgi:hypothetical protein